MCAPAEKNKNYDITGKNLLQKTRKAWKNFKKKIKSDHDYSGKSAMAIWEITYKGLNLKTSPV
jgi:ribosomal protein L20A (L18A)